METFDKNITSVRPPWDLGAVVLGGQPKWDNTNTPWPKPKPLQETNMRQCIYIYNTSTFKGVTCWKPLHYLWISRQDTSLKVQVYSQQN